MNNDKIIESVIMDIMSETNGRGRPCRRPCREQLDDYNEWCN